MKKAFLVVLTILAAAASLHAAARIDTAYVWKDRSTWRIKASGSVSQINVLASGQGDFTPFELDMKSELRKVFTGSVSWHGITFSASFDPFTAAGKKKDFELGLKSYGRKFGAELQYYNGDSFSGTESFGTAAPVNITKGMGTRQTLSLSTYYVWNHKQFSYPAAFMQNTIQKRSAGSFLTGIAVRWQRVTADAQEGAKDPLLFFRVWQLGVGFGYGYNLVLPGDILVHVSAIPYLVVSPDRRFKLEGQVHDFPFVFPDPVLTARGAIVKNFDKVFFGVNSVMNYTGAGRSKGILLEDALWSVNAFIGIRL